MFTDESCGFVASEVNNTFVWYVWCFSQKKVYLDILRRQMYRVLLTHIYGPGDSWLMSIE